MPNKKDALVYVFNVAFWLLWAITLTFLTVTPGRHDLRIANCLAITGGVITSSYLAYRTTRLKF